MALRTRPDHAGRERADGDEMPGDTPSDPQRYLVLLATFFFLFLEAGIIKSFGVLLSPMVYQLDSNFATVGVISSLPWTVEYICAVIVKPLTNHIELHKISSAGGLIAGVSLTTSSFARTTSTLGILFFLFGIGESMIIVPAIICLHRHYKNGFAFASSFAFVGSLMGVFILPIITNVLLEAYGPHNALLVLGGLCLNMLPFGLLFKLPEEIQKRPPAPACEHLLEVADTERCDYFRKMPENTDYFPNSKKRCTDQNTEAHGCLTVTRKRLIEIMSDLKTFIKEAKFFLAFILPCDIFGTFTLIGFSIFIVHFAISVGIPQTNAVFVGTMGGVGGLVARVSGTVILHFHPTWVFGQYLVLCSLTSLMLFLQPLRASYTYLLVCSFFLGFGLYGSVCLTEALVSNVVKPEVFPTTISISYLSKGVGSVLAAYSSGLLYDLTQSNGIVFYILGVLQAINVVIIILLLVTRKRLANSPTKQI
ncbi:monocarboxylate transporter 14-like isoform X1 [Lytechinus variegatus]|uniref:monocarboxylate transporter 14-like isoform X1 n=1 Tax=Lytechinus variegatus TaxID=7654 RepID=UPI001BB140C7|nr:monocarboxylate transporter 14-like isoform X1 [Lytechinus variegatus]